MKHKQFKGGKHLLVRFSLFLMLLSLTASSLVITFSSSANALTKAQQTACFNKYDNSKLDLGNEADRNKNVEYLASGCDGSKGGNCIEQANQVGLSVTAEIQCKKPSANEDGGGSGGGGGGSGGGSSGGGKSYCQKAYPVSNTGSANLIEHQSALQQACKDGFSGDDCSKQKNASAATKAELVSACKKGSNAASNNNNGSGDSGSGSSDVRTKSCDGNETIIIKCGDDTNGIWSVLLLLINIMTAGIGVLAVAGVVYAAVLWTTAEDKEEQVKKARSILTNTVIGLVAFALMFTGLQFIIPGGVFNRPSAVSEITNKNNGGLNIPSTDSGGSDEERTSEDDSKDDSKNDSDGGSGRGSTNDGKTRNFRDTSLFGDEGESNTLLQSTKLWTESIITEVLGSSDGDSIDDTRKLGS